MNKLSFKYKEKENPPKRDKLIHTRPSRHFRSKSKESEDDSSSRSTIRSSSRSFSSSSSYSRSNSKGSIRSSPVYSNEDDEDTADTNDKTIASKKSNKEKVSSFLDYKKKKKTE